LRPEFDSPGEHSCSHTRSLYHYTYNSDLFLHTIFLKKTYTMMVLPTFYCLCYRPKINRKNLSSMQEGHLVEDQMFAKNSRHSYQYQSSVCKFIPRNPVRLSILNFLLCPTLTGNIAIRFILYIIYIQQQCFFYLPVAEWLTCCCLLE
jgi:hypothetical protein